MPKSAIIMKHGLPVLKINDETIFPCGYMSYQIDKADYSGFVACGCKLLFIFFRCAVFTGIERSFFDIQCAYIQFYQ